MLPINITRRTGVPIAANAASPVLAPGTYDIYAKELAVIRVSKQGSVPTETNGYTIPAGAVIPVIIDEKDMKISTTAAIVYHRVG